jgi:endonuclease/exonuclease/phosphatase family metal-dependent hydrolase
MSNDLIVLGVQEVIELKSKNITKFMFGADNDFNHFVDFINHKFKDFDIILNEIQGANGLLVLMKKSARAYFDIWVSKVYRLNLGFMGYMANKCIIGAEIYINNNKIIFFNAHLEAGEQVQSYKKRLENIKQFQNLLKTEQLENELVVLMGDLNFRNSTDYSQMVQMLFEYQENHHKRNKILEKFFKNDELVKLKSDETSFTFKEQKINFLPTYKYLRNL